MTDGSVGYRPCTFRVQCSGADHVYLVGNFSETGRPIVVPLEQAGDSEWSKSIRLRPGSYLFRFYVDDGRLLTWLSTSQRPQGLDSVLVVPPAPPAADQPAADHPAADGECVWQSTARRSPLAGPAPQTDVSSPVACVSVSLARATDLAPATGKEDTVPRRYRLTRIVGGRRRVIETESAAEYLRCLIDEMASDFSVICDVQVTEFADDWLLVDLRHEGETNRPAALRFSEFANELSHVFRTFYQSTADSRDGPSRAWRVRHIRDCPWI